MAPNELAEWYWNVPRLSRYWFTGSVVLPLLGRIGLLSPYSMILVWEKLAYSFHIWRPITALLYYPISPQTGFHYLINLYFLYSYSTALESGQFAGNPAEYAFLLLFCWICLVALGCAVGLYLLMDPMVLAVLYIWCQLNRDTIVQFWFGMQFKAMYLPWDLGGRQLIGAPEFLYRLLPRQRGGVSGFGVPPSNRRREDGTDGAGDDERRGWLVSEPVPRGWT
uniref:Derlin n=1 Tax=Macrostomum lignano TaxID=282301 RepID=A0A1I8G198_9PLAT